jgi:radical SAM protein with 4Fe4S-binding SPASM domain
VFSFNEHEIDATRSYCQQNGIVFNQRDAFIDKEKHADWFPSYRKSELEAKKEWGKKETDEKTLPTSTQIETRSAHTVRHKTCSWHYAMSVVNADGSVSPCCAPWNQKYDCGKIEKSTKFSEIWNNTYYRRSRASFVGKPLDDFGNVETLCEKCPYDESIQNLYMHLNYEVERRFWELFRNKDPTLEGAFSRLNDPSAFIEYCDQHAINKRGLIW